MENVRQMDWAAPESLRRDRNEGRTKKAIRIKKEVSATDSLETEVVDIEEAAATGEVDLANALDLSDSEEEEELEDLIEDFALQADMEQDSGIRQERLYFFQFPNPFPTFLKKAPLRDEMPMNVDCATPHHSQESDLCPGLKTCSTRIIHGIYAYLSCSRKPATLDGRA